MPQRKQDRALFWFSLGPKFVGANEKFCICELWGSSLLVPRSWDISYSKMKFRLPIRCRTAVIGACFSSMWRGKKTSFSEDRRYIENGSEETECREPRIQSLGHIRMRGRVLSPEISTNWILIGLIRGATKLRVWNWMAEYRRFKDIEEWNCESRSGSANHL